MSGGGCNVNFAEANLDWSMAESWRVPASSARLEPWILDALGRACETNVTQKAPGIWHAQFTRWHSAFNRCTVVVELSEAAADESVVRAKVTFEPSVSRVTSMLWLATSVIGLPVAYGWRAGSLRGCASLARRVMDALAIELDAFRKQTLPYR